MEPATATAEKSPSLIVIKLKGRAEGAICFRWLWIHACLEGRKTFYLDDTKECLVLHDSRTTGVTADLIHRTTCRFGRIERDHSRMKMHVVTVPSVSCIIIVTYYTS